MNVRLRIHPAIPVPPAFRANFLHLYFDITWFGVLAASAMAFVGVYAARLGASALQIGLLSAGPAAVSLVFTLPAGQWLESQPIDAVVGRAAALTRLWYLLWIPLPSILGSQGQVWALIGLSLLMSIPGTALAVGFNALFAEAVPLEWRGYVVGLRNALLAITFILVSLLCGLILDRTPFPVGYQIVFGIGFLGAAMSTVHVWMVVLPRSRLSRPREGRSLGDLAWPGMVRMLVDGLRPGVALRFLTRRRSPLSHRFGIVRGPFGRLLVVFFCFHLALYLAIPLFPLQWVQQIHLTDRDIGLGTAIFYLCVFLGSTQLARVSWRLGNQKVTAMGALLMASYPAFMALAGGRALFWVGSAAGGLGWSLAGGALTNYLLERIPQEHRPSYLAWYNLTLNAALLLGSLAGPVIAGAIGLPAALLVFSGLRFLAAIGILFWG